jgi:hypothetical protein
MRRFGFLVLAGFIGLGSIAATSCSNSVSKADFKKELDAQPGIAGTVDTQCLVDKLEASGFQFRKYGDLTADENSKLTTAVQQCVAAGGVTTPTS